MFRRLLEAVRRSKEGRIGAAIMVGIGILDWLGRIKEVRELLTGVPPILRKMIMPDASSGWLHLGVFALGILIVIRAVQSSSRSSSLLTLLGVELKDATEDSGVTYKKKLWATLRNDSGGVLHVSAPTWTPGSSGVQVQHPFEAKVGLKRGHEYEKDDVWVPHGQRVYLWLGLALSLSVEDFDYHRRVGQLGTLEFHLEQDGKHVTQSINVK